MMGWGGRGWRKILERLNDGRILFSFGGDVIKNVKVLDGMKDIFFLIL